MKYAIKLDTENFDLSGTVAVAPADGGGGLLVRDEPQEGRGDRVAEGREGSGVRQIAADDAGKFK